MQSAPLPVNEDEQLVALLALGVMDTGHATEFNASVTAAPAVCGRVRPSATQLFH